MSLLPKANARLNTYYLDQVGSSLKNASQTISSNTHIRTGTEAAEVIAMGLFGNLSQRQTVLNAIEAFYQADPNGIYEMVLHINTMLEMWNAGLAVTLERVSDHESFGGVLNLFELATQKLVDTLPFKLDFATGNLVDIY